MGESNIEVIRKKKGKTQAAMAEVLGIVQSAYSNKVSKSNFSEEEIAKLAKFLKVQPLELMDVNVQVNFPEFMVQKTIQQDSMLRVLLRSVAEILANQKGIPVGPVISQLIKEVNSESADSMNELKQ